MAFTKPQKKLLRKCIDAGYGWRKFAESVKKLGKCSLKQEETLRSMVQRIDMHSNIYSDSDEPDISDLEAMSSGDYF